MWNIQSQKMGIIVKQTIKSSIFAYVGIALGFITTAFLMPKALNQAQVGLVRLLVSIMVVLSQAANLGFNAAGSRLFPYFRNENNKHNGYFFWACTVSFIGLIITLGTFAINYDWLLNFLNVKASPLLKDYLFWVFPLTIFGVYFLVFDNYQRVLYDTVSGTFLKEFAQRIFLLIAVIIYLLGWVTFGGFVTFYCIGLCLPTLFMLLQIIRKGNFTLKIASGFWTKKLKIEFASLSFLTFLSGFSSQIVNYLDQIQVTSIINLDANGIYATMLMFGTVIYMPTTMVARIGSTIIAEAWKNQDIKIIKDVYEKSCLNLLIVGSLLFLCVVLNLHNIFEVLPTYKAGYWVVIWIAIGKLFDMATGLNGLILQTSKYYFYDIIFMIILIVGTWFLNQLFIPIYGITGSALATTLMIFLFNFFRTIFVWRVFGFWPFTLKNLYIILILLMVFTLIFFIPKLSAINFIPSYIVDTLMRTVLAGGLFCIIIYFTNISSDFKQIINQLFKKLV